MEPSPKSDLTKSDPHPLNHIPHLIYPKDRNTPSRTNRNAKVMAYVQSRRRAAPSKYPDNKENQPPKKRKKVASSVNNLLKKSKSKHRTAREVLAPLSDGISNKAKEPQPQPDFFKRFAKKRKGSDDDPLRVVPGFFRKIDQDKEQERALDTGYAGMSVRYHDVHYYAN